MIRFGPWKLPEKNLNIFPPVLKGKGKKESIKGEQFSNKLDFQFI